MSIRPILFNTEMVRAISDWRKTVTRRVVKPHNSKKAKLCEYTQGNELWIEDGHIKDYSVSSCWMKIEDYISKYYIYKPGSILWVRETWSPVLIRHIRYLYKCFCPEAEGLPVRWHPSIHMPKAAARLFLRVKSVRVERLQEITIDGIEQEGVTLTFPLKKLIESEHLKRFSNLWTSTIKPADLPRYGWDANPFVWVVEFERCEKPEGFV